MADTEETPKSLDEEGKELETPPTGDGKPEGEEPKPEGGEEDAGEGAPAPEPDDDTPPLVRKSVAQHVADRQAKSAAKKAKAEETGNEETTGNPGETDPKTETPNSIQEEVAKQMQPLVESTRSTVDDAELQQVLAAHPDAKGMEKQIRKYMNHPSYSEVPVEFIYNALTSGKSAAQKEKEVADEEAKGTRTGGHGKKTTTSESELPDANSLTDAEFDAAIMKTKIGQG